MLKILLSSLASRVSPRQWVAVAVFCALTAFCGVLWLRLSATSARLEKSLLEASQAHSALSEQREATLMLAKRFDALDSVLTQMHGALEANRAQMQAAQRAIQSVQLNPSLGDTHESLTCLDVPVPADLAGRL